MIFSGQILTRHSFCYQMTEELLVKTLLDARPRLIAATLAVLRDVHQAENVFQEVMIKALRMRESFSDEGGHSPGAALAGLAWAARRGNGDCRSDLDGSRRR